MWVIKRNSADGGGYVTRSGSRHSYTRSLEAAQVFDTEERARGAACGNEAVVSVSRAMGR